MEDVMSWPEVVRRGLMMEDNICDAEIAFFDFEEQ